MCIRDRHTLCPFHRYGVVIAARNESMVIGNLIRSIQNQTYPSKLIDIFVVADNCTDNTAQIARQLGAVVYERFNKEQVGKGYALDFAFRHIAQDYGANYHDAYLIFDADNLLDSHYSDEMNEMCIRDRYVSVSLQIQSHHLGSGMQEWKVCWKSKI